MRKILSDLIHPAQNGFLQKRNLLQISIQLLIYWIIMKHSDKQTALIFLGTEKAFDTVSWAFLMTYLEYFEFSYRTLHVIEQIYSTQLTKIIVNGELTGPKQIQKGTRQDYPLSPLIFIFSLEVLLNQISMNSDIKGLKIKGLHFKLRAFTNDLLIILEDTEETVTPLCQLLKHYGQISGLKINKQKRLF